MLHSLHIFCQCNMLPNLLHTSTTSCCMDHLTGTASEGSCASKPSCSSVTLASGTSSTLLVPGKSRRAGIENSTHHAPELPVVNHSAFIDPPACWTGIRVINNNKIPAAYPRAMLSEEMQAVVWDSFSASL